MKSYTIISITITSITYTFIFQYLQNFISFHNFDIGIYTRFPVTLHRWKTRRSKFVHFRGIITTHLDR